MLARNVENQLRDPLSGRIAVEEVDRFAERPQRGDERIVPPQDHAVIQLAIDPALHDSFDVAEIDDHVSRIETVGLNVDLDDGVMAVRMLTDTLVVHQPMAVAELDPLGNGVHTNVCLHIPWSVDGP